LLRVAQPLLDPRHHPYVEILRLDIVCGISSEDRRLDEPLVESLVDFSAVCTLVVASDLLTAKVTTWPGTAMPPASVRTALTSAGLAAEIVVLLTLRVKVAVEAAPGNAGAPV
jgi:hypothetical protein